MKVLVFSIGADRYGLRLGAIVRVLPAALLRQLPLAPPCVAGLMDLHGEPVPVIDLSRLAGVTPRQVWFDTRIILVDYKVGDDEAGNNGAVRPLGLMAEHVLGIETLIEAALTDSGIRAAPFLGQVAATGAGMLQLVELDQLLPPDVRALLFQAAAAAP
jgi:chemotaxis-related protein WspB